MNKTLKTISFVIPLIKEYLTHKHHKTFANSSFPPAIGNLLTSIHKMAESPLVASIYKYSVFFLILLWKTNLFNVKMNDFIIIENKK